MTAAPSAAVVLAAGAGTRYAGAGHKLAADAGGEPVVVRSVAAAVAAGFDDVVVVWGALPLEALLSAHDATRTALTVFNPRWREGMATSLALGIATAAARGHRSVVVGLGDMPAVTAADWQAVAGCDDSPIAVARWADGHLSPPVRLRHDVWDRLPVAGDAGARVLWSTEGDVAVTAVDRPGAGLDVDTVADLTDGTDPR